MSREDIAAAATVTGLTRVTPSYRQSLKPGDGFVRLARRNRAENGFGFISTWEVWIALPGSWDAAERWLEQHLDGLITAIDHAMVVSAATPSELVLGSATVNGVIITGSTAT